MRHLVTLITAAAFVLHFTLGCCAHHAHAAGATVCHSHVHMSVVDHDHDHDGHDHDSHEPGEQSPGDSECPWGHCSDSHCVFMVAGKTVLAKATFTTIQPLLVAEPASFSPNSLIAAAAIDSGGLIALPVRIHLINQVLLI